MVDYRAAHDTSAAPPILLRKILSARSEILTTQLGHHPPVATVNCSLCQNPFSVGFGTLPHRRVGPDSPPFILNGQRCFEHVPAVPRGGGRSSPKRRASRIGCGKSTTLPHQAERHTPPDDCGFLFSRIEVSTVRWQPQQAKHGSFLSSLGHDLKQELSPNLRQRHVSYFVDGDQWRQKEQQLGPVVLVPTDK